VRSESLEPGYLARPEEAGANGLPGVVLIHDVWGLAEHPRDLARRLAGEGFAVLAVDLYRRLSEVHIEDPGAWMRGLSDPQVMADVGEAAELLAGHPDTAGRGTGVVGFCMGGSYALMAGCGGWNVPGLERVDAVVPFYGILSHRHGLLHDPEGLDPAKKPREPLDAARELRCPLLGLFGGRDAFVPLEDIRELERRLEATGQPTEIVVYPECGHAFLNDTRPQAYREREAGEAWRRMVDFLRERL